MLNLRLLNLKIKHGLAPPPCGVLKKKTLVPVRFKAMPTALIKSSLFVKSPLKFGPKMVEGVSRLPIPKRPAIVPRYCRSIAVRGFQIFLSRNQSHTCRKFLEQALAFKNAIGVLRTLELYRRAL